MAAVLALVSALAFGVSDFVGGVATRRAPAPVVVLVSNGLSLVLAAAVVALVPGSVFSAADLAWGAAAGAAGVGGVLLLYTGLALGPMSVIAPFTAVLSALIPALVGVFRGERPGAAAIAGLVLAGPAIILISRQPERCDPVRLTAHAVVSALGAGLAFGTFYVLMGQTSSRGLAWPLLGQRAASVLVLMIIVLRRPRGSMSLPRGSTATLAGLAGLTDFAANLAYVTATHIGLLALVAVVSSFYPATTVLLAAVVLGERLAPTQLAGLAMVMASVALIAVR